ncbi:MFS transporter [Bacillus sp. FJAT-29953]|nr:MFS transporter [Bacillus sp. FJAT-29953]
MYTKLTIFFLLMFLIASNSFLLSPLLPVLQIEFQITTVQAGWMISSYALTYAVFSLLFGPISDKWNRKKVMMYGLVGYAMAIFLCGFSSSWLEIILYQAIAGLFAALITPQVWASITILIPPDRLVMGMGVVIGGVSAAQVLGLPLGSFLASISWSIPYFVLSLEAIVIIILLIWLIPSLPPPSVEKKPNPFVEPYRQLLKSSKARFGFLAYLVFAIGYYATFTFFGKWLADRFQLDVKTAGMVFLFFGLGSLIGSLFGSPLVTKLTRFHTLNIGAVMMSILYIILPMSKTVLYVEVLLFTIAAIGGVLISVILSSLQTISSTQRGTVAALSNSCQYFGSMIGTGMAGVLYSTLNGFFSVSLFASLMFLLSIFLFIKSKITNDKTFEQKGINEAEGITGLIK